MPIMNLCDTSDPADLPQKNYFTSIRGFAAVQTPESAMHQGWSPGFDSKPDPCPCLYPIHTQV